MYDLIWMLAGELDTYLIFDLYNAYSAAQSDPKVRSIYERFRAGDVNRTIVPEVFALDRKYNEFSWWQRVRGRLLTSVEKYIAGTLVVKDLVSSITPPMIEYGEGGEVIIAGVKVRNKTAIESTTTGMQSITTEKKTGGTMMKEDEFESIDNSDEDILDLLNNFD